MKKILLIMLFIFLTFPSWVTAKNSKISLYLSKHDSFRIAGFLMAKKLGLYKKEGLDVTMIYEADHEKRTRKVLNEEHSYAVGSFAIVQEIAKKKDLALIGSIFQQTPLVLVYTNSKPYKNLTDLKGTTIMVSSWEEKAFLKLLLKQEGIRLDAVNIVEGSHPEKDFIQGNISAYVSSKALIASQLKEQPNSYRLVEPKTLGVEIYDDLLVTSTQQLNRFPKQVEAFYKASIRGWNYAFSHMYKSAVEIVSWNPDMIIDPLGLVVQADALKPFAMQQGSFLGQIDFVKVQKMMRYFDMQDAAPNKVNQLLYNKGHLKSETIYSEKEQLWLRQQKPIRVCIDRGFMPIESFNEQDLAVGILTDIIDVMRQKMNIKFEPIPVSGFMEKLEGLRKNRCDMVVIHHEDDTIEEHIHTVAMLETPMVYITQGSEPFFSSFSKMRDKKIAVTKDDPAIKALNRRYPEIELIEVESAAVGLKGVSKGQYDTFIGLLSVSTYYINAQGLSNLKVAGHIDVTMPLRLLLSKNDQSLMMLLNKAVQTMTESEKQQVIQKWMQVDYK
ncbi:MAG: ABC transporter substrate-binding protein, partial [Thiovulaceae bacterium]|nr:ABC transporter substrate-binding protein [Sulfurimonadaceae bacterium]